MNEILNPTEEWCRLQLKLWKKNKKDAIRWLSTPNSSFPQNMTPMQMLLLGKFDTVGWHIWYRRFGAPH